MLEKDLSEAQEISEKGGVAGGDVPGAGNASSKGQAGSSAGLSQDDRNRDAKARSENKASSNRDLDLIFGEIVAFMMRSPLYRHCSLADLEWLLLPPLLTRQFQMIRGQKKDPGKDQKSEQSERAVPLGVALWAQVSAEVDQKLQAQKSAGLPIARLTPQEWRSGDIPWLLAVAAPDQTKAMVVEKLAESIFKGKDLKVFPKLQAKDK